ncbi:hypothetical protein [Marinagarivorans algicola]|uniref:hypothetical protein n=1 Tax=Marinagarivorans algicola TaxID=1513270 RepID=UPI0006B68178|nr:hypothetical protein [Marinagarivorans algicola]
MINDKIDSRGTYFSFLKYFEEIAFEDVMTLDEKSKCYKKIHEEFFVDLSLMLVYEGFDASEIDSDRFWSFFDKYEFQFSTCFKSTDFYIYINTYPDKILVKVSGVFLANILSFDWFGFEYFVCDVGYNFCLTETRRDSVYVSGRFEGFFQSLT